MNQWDTDVPGVSTDSFRRAYEVAEAGVLKNPGPALDLDETLRPTIRIARTIARQLVVDPEELYAMSVRVCALWRLLASEPAQLGPLGIVLSEEGVRCDAARRAALLDTAASSPLSEDLRFDPDDFLTALKDRVA